MKVAKGMIAIFAIKLTLFITVFTFQACSTDGNSILNNDMSIMIYLLAPLYLKVFVIRIKGVLISYRKNLKERLKAELVMLILLCIVGISLFILFKR